MALGNYVQERQLPFLCLMAAGVVCIAFFLLAFSVSSYPSQVQPIKLQALMSKEDVKADNSRLKNSPDDLGPSNQQVIQNEQDSVLNGKRHAEIDGDPKKLALEGIQKQENQSIAIVKQNDLEFKWEICQGNGSADFIPCLDNAKAIKKLESRRHMEHRERHCPTRKDLPRCLPPLPNGYRLHVHWPQSRDMIVPTIAWGKRTRVVLDVGCGVASFGGYLFDKGVLTMSFAPKDEHEAQVQLALERGIPAILSVIGTQRLVFPSNVYDVIHCARCRVHWHGDGGKPLLEINRILRPGGFFVWSATPVYRDDPADRDVWRAVVALTESMCWTLVRKTTDSAGIGFAVYQKPVSNSCYMQRKEHDPPFCKEDDRPNAAWYVPLQRCLHWVPTVSSLHGSIWPPAWPLRLEHEPFWLNNTLRSTPGLHSDYHKDTMYWRHVVQRLYLHDLGIDWSIVRNVMDMRAGYGG